MQFTRLVTINCAKLQHCEEERSRLFKACRDDGLFYLDMREVMKDIDTTVADIYSLQRKIFDLSEEEKMKYDVDVLSPRKLNG